jgi:predicted hydrocarbon binding protein
MEDRYVTVLRYHPAGRYFLISVKIREQVGALADLTKILAVRGFNILEGHFFSPKDNPSGFVTVIAETSGPKTDIQFVQQLLESSPYLESVSIAESKKGLIIDSLNFPVRLGSGGRMVMLQTGALQKILRSIRAKLGEGADEFVYGLGLDYGTQTWRELFSGLPGEQDVVQYELELLTALGMGRAKVTGYKAQPPSVKLSIEGSFECEGEKSDSPACHFLSGMLAGGLGVAMHGELGARETKCAAKGARACEFEVGARDGSHRNWLGL